MKKKEKVESLEKLLVAAYRNQPRPEISPDWYQGVMRKIKRISRQARQPRLSFFERVFPEPLLFKFAGVSGACALAMMVFFLSSQGGINQEFSRLFLNDPLGTVALAFLAP
jgi:hypothetical protein